MKLTKRPVAIRVQIPNTTFRATSLYSSIVSRIMPSSYCPASEVPAKLASSVDGAVVVVAAGYSVGVVYQTMGAGACGAVDG